MNTKLFKISIVTLFVVLISCNSNLKDSKIEDEITLESQLNELIKNFKGEAHLYAKNLTTGEIIDIDANSTHNAASEAKLYILLTYAEQVSKGTLDPTTRITLQQEDEVLGSGVLRFEMPGNQVSLSFLAYLMMSISDNVATNLLLREVGGPKAVDTFLKNIGIEDTKVDGEVFKGKWITTSAKSLGIAAQVLARPETFSYPKEAADLCKKIMLKHYEDNGMARYLPWSPFTELAKIMLEEKSLSQEIFDVYAGIELYGKAGFTIGYRGDVAYFITPKSEYIIGLKCTNVDETKPLNATNDGFQFSADIGKLFYDYWGKKQIEKNE